MNYDDKSTHGYSSVSCTDTLLFLGHFGPDSKISIYRFQNDVKYIGSLTSMIGSVLKSIINSDCTRIVSSTSCGYLYVWDISEDVIQRLESLTNNPLYSDGYIPLDSRINPIAIIAPNNLGDCIDFDLMFEDSIIISIEKWPVLNLNFYNVETGKKVAISHGVLKNNVNKSKYMNCIKVDSLISDGQWVSCCTAGGLLCLIYISRDSLNEGDDTKVLELPLEAYTQELDSNININSISWRPRNSLSSNLTILCGCSDGIVRCSVFQLLNDRTKLELYKQASYSYCKSSFKGSVYRMKCIKDVSSNVPYVVASCNMINELGGNNQSSTSNTFECVYQKLLQDSSEQITSLGAVPGFITDFCITPNHRSIIITSSNEHVYISNKDDGLIWKGSTKLI